MAAVSEREHAVELLKTAIAGLGEAIADAGAVRLPKTTRRTMETLRRLEALAGDAAVLTQACLILLRRPDLLGVPP